LLWSAKKIGVVSLFNPNTIKLSGNLDANNNKIISLSTPTLPNDAVNKQYVDSLVSSSGGGGGTTDLSVFNQTYLSNYIGDLTDISAKLLILLQ
jgi:hypothetical protein